MGFIAKTDINGNILWEKEIHIYATDGQETENAIHNSIQDSAGNIYGIGSFATRTSSYENPFIFKLNPLGEKEWGLMYDSPDFNAHGYDIAFAKDGNLIALMRDIFPDESLTKCNILKYSPQGELIWNCPVPSFASDTNTGVPYIRDIEVLPSGDIIGGGDCYYQISYMFWQNSPFVARINNSGRLAWDNVPRTNDTVSPVNIDKIVLQEGTNEFIGLGEYLFQNFSSPTLFRYDISGHNIKNNRSFEFDGYSITKYFSGTMVNDSTMINSARWHPKSYAPDTLPYIEFSGKSLAIKLDTNGIIMKIKVLIDDDMGFPAHVAKTPDNKFLFFGYEFDENTIPTTVLFKLNSDLEYDSLQTDTNHYDPWCPGGISSGAVEFYAEDFIITTATGELPKKPENKIQIAPNPAQGQINIRFETLPQKGELLVFDLQGRMLATYPLPQGTEEYVLSLEGYKSGNYILQVVYGNDFVGARQFGVIQ